MQMSIEVASEVPHRGALVRRGLALASVALFFTNFDGYAFATQLGPPPVRWVLLMVAAAAALVVIEPRRPLALLHSPVVHWAFFYFLLTTLWGTWATSVPEVTQTLYDRYRSIATLLAFTVIFDDPRARRHAALAVAAAVVMASLVNVGEMLSLVSFAEIADMPRAVGRSSGFYLNPNIAGMAIALGLAATIESLPRAWRVPLILVSALGTAATFSRAAMLMMGVVVLWLALRGGLGGVGAAVAAVSLVGLFAYASQYMEAHRLMTEETAARAHLLQGDSGRIRVGLKAWEMFWNAPILGNGVGSTRIWDEPVRAHNMFLTLAADHGILGLLAFPALALALISGNPGATCFALALMAGGAFSHDLLEQPQALLLISLMSARCPASNDADASPGKVG
jgi:hypothetical protein